MVFRISDCRFRIVHLMIEEKPEIRNQKSAIRNPNNMDLKGKKILLGITGSIAAYKAVFLLRLLIREGAEVKVILTPFADKFVTKGTLAALSAHAVLSEFLKEDGTWNSHVELATWADIFLIAPVTATTMAKMAIGLPDNLLIATYMAAKCPVVFAPAMDLDMYKHPATQKNIAILQSHGNILIEPAIGELASGLHGIGRLQEPEVILKKILPVLFPEKKNLKPSVS
jgi:phosphopantothenoylcysteine decarboxylase/phosphopantothenate--cysteine ligase